MKTWIDCLFHSSVVRFLIVGAGNTLLSMALMFLLEGLGYWPSTAIAYLAGAVMSFFLNRRFTFHSEEAFWPSAGKFALNAAVCYALGYGAARLLFPGRPGSLDERLSKLAGMAFYTVLNYCGQRFFAFRRRG